MLAFSLILAELLTFTYPFLFSTVAVVLSVLSSDTVFSVLESSVCTDAPAPFIKYFLIHPLFFP